jgi:hypothetical protein
MTHREPTEEEKRTIIAQHTRDGKVRCYVNDHPIEDEEIEFHHIKPFSEEGKTEVSNLAPVCKEHHRRIRTLSITEFRTRLEMEEFFKSPEPRKLDDVLKKKIGDGNFGKNLTYEISDKGIKLFLQDKSEPTVLLLYTCASTGYKYFYVTLPVMYIQNDTDLQPRPIEMRRLWELYRHMLTHTQLSPAICRLEANKILLFDGQHKSAAQIWCGRKEIECKVYIEPDLRILKETNIAAHDKLRQMQFFTSVLISKWADLFKEEWGEYLESKGIKSEKGFIEFLEKKGKKKSEALNMLRSNIYDSVLDDRDNKIVDYIAERNRTRKNPLTIHSIKQTLFKHFITDAPLDIDIEQSDELREYERNNVVKLLNILSEETLDGKWDPTRNDSSHKLAERIYAAGSLKAWSRMLRDVTAVVLKLYDEDERGKIFLRKISGDDWELIRGRITRLFGHKLWTDPSPEIDSNLRVNNERHVKEFFENRGLKVDWILGG